MNWKTGRVIRRLGPLGSHLSSNGVGGLIVGDRYERNDRVISIRAMPSLKVLQRLKERGQVFQMEFSPCSRWLATVGDEWDSRLWDVKTGRKAYMLAGGQEPVYSVAFTPDGKWITVGGKDCELRIWRVPH